MEKLLSRVTLPQLVTLNPLMPLVKQGPDAKTAANGGPWTLS